VFLLEAGKLSIRASSSSLFAELKDCRLVERRRVNDSSRIPPSKTLPSDLDLFRVQWNARFFPTNRTALRNTYNECFSIFRKYIDSFKIGWALTCRRRFRQRSFVRILRERRVSWTQQAERGGSGRYSAILFPVVQFPGKFSRYALEAVRTDGCANQHLVAAIYASRRSGEPSRNDLAIERFADVRRVL